MSRSSSVQKKEVVITIEPTIQQTQVTNMNHTPVSNMNMNMNMRHHYNHHSPTSIDVNNFVSISKNDYNRFISQMKEIEGLMNQKVHLESMIKKKDEDNGIVINRLRMDNQEVIRQNQNLKYITEQLQNENNNMKCEILKKDNGQSMKAHIDKLVEQNNQLRYEYNQLYNSYVQRQNQKQNSHDEQQNNEIKVLRDKIGQYKLYILKLRSNREKFMKDIFGKAQGQYTLERVLNQKIEEFNQIVDEEGITQTNDSDEIKEQQMEIKEQQMEMNEQMNEQISEIQNRNDGIDFVYVNEQTDKSFDQIEIE